jgi:ribosomal protein S27E
MSPCSSGGHPPGSGDAAPHADRRPSKYRRRTPEATVLHELVRDHLPALVEAARERSEHGYGYPRFIEETFAQYLRCGQLCYGFLRVRCNDCGYDQLVALSCKRRGLCPSCCTRRMHDTAAHLVDRVLPDAPYRQWVVSFPRHVRFRLALDPELLTRVLRGCLQVIFAWQRRRARELGAPNGQCGSTTFVQRFGGFANLNVHFHSLIPDGVFVRNSDTSPTLIRLAPPSDADIASLVEKIARRTTKLIARHDEDRYDDASNAGDPLAQTQADSIRARAWAPRGDPRVEARGRRSAFLAGFSLHAGVAVGPHNRDGLERLCRYGLRPAIDRPPSLAWPGRPMDRSSTPSNVRPRVEQPAWCARPWSSCASSWR